MKKKVSDEDRIKNMVEEMNGMKEEKPEEETEAEEDDETEKAPKKRPGLFGHEGALHIVLGMMRGK